MSTPSPYDIPPEMRDFAEKSVDQARKAFDGFMGAAHKAAELMDGAESVPPAVRDVGRKALAFTEQNVSATLDFAARLVNARDPQDMLRLQTGFLQRQLQTFGEQARDMGSTASRMANDFAKR